MQNYLSQWGPIVKKGLPWIQKKGIFFPKFKGRRELSDLRNSASTLLESKAANVAEVVRWELLLFADLECFIFVYSVESKYSSPLS